jgi:cyclic beta-1,2-glucan synthetase
LQDVLALLHTRPAIARARILDATERQFAAVNVLHWWHPPSGRGVRTHCSDDLLGLPFATAHDVSVTGDTSILTERRPFLRGDPLAPEQDDRYDLFTPTAETATLYEHCCRALARGATAGVHGLPLIGSGDWNDGMNRVGVGRLCTLSRALQRASPHLAAHTLPRAACLLKPCLTAGSCTVVSYAHPPSTRSPVWPRPRSACPCPILPASFCSAPT